MFDRTPKTIQLQLFGFNQIRLPHTLFEHVYLQLALQLWQYNQEHHENEITDFDLPLCRNVWTNDLIHIEQGKHSRKVWPSKRTFNLPVTIYENDFNYRLMWGSLVSDEEGYEIVLEQSNGLPTYVEYHKLDPGKQLDLIWRVSKNVKPMSISVLEQIHESNCVALVSTWQTKNNFVYEGANMSEIDIGISEKPIPVQELCERLLDRITS